MRIDKSESPFLRIKAGREFQGIVADRMLWLQYVTLGPRDMDSVRASSLYVRKGFISRGMKPFFTFMRKLTEKVKPKRKQPIYNPKKEEKSLENYDEWLFDFLQDDWNQTYKEIGETGSFLGYMSGYLSGNDQSDYSKSLDDYQREFRQRLGLSQESTIEEYEDKLDRKLERTYALNYAERDAAKWIAIYDENGERAGRPYEVISKMYRQMVVEAIKSGKTVEQLQSDMAYPDLMELVESGKISMDDYISVMKDDKTNMRLNRNFQRFAWTEASYAFSNGRLQALAEKGQSYVIFKRGVGAVL